MTDQRIAALISDLEAQRDELDRQIRALRAALWVGTGQITADGKFAPEVLGGRPTRAVTRPGTAEAESRVRGVGRGDA